MIKIHKLVFNTFQVNTYIIYDHTKDCIIVDPACSQMEENNLLEEFITNHGLNPVLHLNTHCHIDHVIGIPFVKKKWEIPSAVNENELEILQNAPLMGEVFGFKLDTAPEIEKNIEHQEIIYFGESKLTAFLVPGHSPGSIAFYSQEGEFVISGDVLFQGSIGRTDLPGGDYDTLISSIRENLLTLPDSTVVYPGHGSSSTIKNEKISNPFINA